MAVAIALPMTFLSDWVVELLYGSEYSEAASVLMIHIWAGVFVALGVTASKWVISENLLQNALIRTTAGAVLNIVLNYILIQRYNIVGVAFATLISYFFVNYFSLSFYKKTRKCFLQQTEAFNLFKIIRRKS
jgi:O-antigen/teichoic acid export membrane protein